MLRKIVRKDIENLVKVGYVMNVRGMVCAPSFTRLLRHQKIYKSRFQSYCIYRKEGLKVETEEAKAGKEV